MRNISIQISAVSVLDIWQNKQATGVRLCDHPFYFKLKTRRVSSRRHRCISDKEVVGASFEPSGHEIGGRIARQVSVATVKSFCQQPGWLRTNTRGKKPSVEWINSYFSGSLLQNRRKKNVGYVEEKTGCRLESPGVVSGVGGTFLFFIFFFNQPSCEIAGESWVAGVYDLNSTRGLKEKWLMGLKKKQQQLNLLQEVGRVIVWVINFFGGIQI